MSAFPSAASRSLYDGGNVFADLSKEPKRGRTSNGGPGTLPSPHSPSKVKRRRRESLHGRSSASPNVSITDQRVLRPIDAIDNAARPDIDDSAGHTSDRLRWTPGSKSFVAVDRTHSGDYSGDTHDDEAHTRDRIVLLPTRRARDLSRVPEIRRSRRSNVERSALFGTSGAAGHTTADSPFHHSPKKLSDGQTVTHFDSPHFPSPSPVKKIITTPRKTPLSPLKQAYTPAMSSPLARQVDDSASYLLDESYPALADGFETNVMSPPPSDDLGSELIAGPLSASPREEGSLSTSTARNVSVGNDDVHVNAPSQEEEESLEDIVLEVGNGDLLEDGQSAEEEELVEDALEMRSEGSDQDQALSESEGSIQFPDEETAHTSSPVNRREGGREGKHIGTDMPMQSTPSKVQNQTISTIPNSFDRSRGKALGAVAASHQSSPRVHEVADLSAMALKEGRPSLDNARHGSRTARRSADVQASTSSLGVSRVAAHGLDEAQTPRSSQASRSRPVQLDLQVPDLTRLETPKRTSLGRHADADASGSGLRPPFASSAQFSATPSPRRTLHSEAIEERIRQSPSRRTRGSSSMLLTSPYRPSVHGTPSESHPSSLRKLLESHQKQAPAAPHSPSSSIAESLATPTKSLRAVAGRKSTPHPYRLQSGLSEVAEEEVGLRSRTATPKARPGTTHDEAVAPLPEIDFSTILAEEGSEISSSDDMERMNLTFTKDDVADGAVLPLSTKHAVGIDIFDVLEYATSEAPVTHAESHADAERSSRLPSPGSARRRLSTRRSMHSTAPSPDQGKQGSDDDDGWHASARYDDDDESEGGSDAALSDTDEVDELDDETDLEEDVDEEDEEDVELMHLESEADESLHGNDEDEESEDVHEEASTVGEEPHTDEESVDYPDHISAQSDSEPVPVLEDSRTDHNLQHSHRKGQPLQESDNDEGGSFSSNADSINELGWMEELERDIPQTIFASEDSESIEATGAFHEGSDEDDDEVRDSSILVEALETDDNDYEDVYGNEVPHTHEPFRMHLDGHPSGVSGHSSDGESGETEEAAEEEADSMADEEEESVASSSSAPSAPPIDPRMAEERDATPPSEDSLTEDERSVTPGHEPVDYVYAEHKAHQVDVGRSPELNGLPHGHNSTFGNVSASMTTLLRRRTAILGSRPNMVEVTSMNRDAAARAAAILKKHHRYVQYGQLEANLEDDTWAEALSAGLDLSDVEIDVAVPGTPLISSPSVVRKATPTPAAPRSQTGVLQAQAKTPKPPGAFPGADTSIQATSDPLQLDRERTADKVQTRHAAGGCSDAMAFEESEWACLELVLMAEIVARANALRSQRVVSKSESLFLASGHLDVDELADFFLAAHGVSYAIADNEERKWSRAATHRRIRILIKSFVKDLQQRYPHMSMDQEMKETSYRSDDGPPPAPQAYQDESVLDTTQRPITFRMVTASTPGRTGRTRLSSLPDEEHTVPKVYPTLQTQSREAIATSTRDAAGETSNLSRFVQGFGKIASYLRRGGSGNLVVSDRTLAAVEDDIIGGDLSDLPMREAGLDAHPVSYRRRPLPVSSSSLVASRVAFVDERRAMDVSGPSAHSFATGRQWRPPSNDVARFRLAPGSGTTFSSSSIVSPSSTRRITTGSSSYIHPTALSMLSPATHAIAREKVDNFRESRTERHWRTPNRHRTRQSEVSGEASRSTTTLNRSTWSRRFEN